MYFSFHEMEVIMLTRLPHKFIERINRCLYRVSKPHTNIKVIVNRPFGATEFSNRRSNSWTFFMFYSNVGFQACTRCAALEMAFGGLPVSLLSLLKDGHHARLLCFKTPFTTWFSCLLPSSSACKQLSFRHFKCFENPVTRLFSVFLNEISDCTF